MALDDFEKELFNDMDGYQSNLNLDQEWQELEERLPKKKKRRFFIWWFSGLAIFIMVTGILFYNNKNTNTVLETTSTITSISKDKEANFNQNPKEATATIKQVLTNKQIPLSSETNNLSTNSKSSKSNINISSKNSKNLTKNQKQLSIAKNQNHIVPENKFSNKAQIDFNPKPKYESPIAVLPKPMEKINLNYLSSPISYLNIKTEELEIPGDYYLKNITPTLPKKKNGTVQPKWSIAIGATYGTNQLKRKSSNLDFQNQIDFLSGYEKQVDYMRIHFKLYRILNKNFSLFSGIYANQQTSLFQLGESFEVERNNPTSLLEQHYLLSGIVENFYGEGVSQFDVAIQSTLWQKYRSIGIPIGISINKGVDKKWSIQNDLAFVISPFQSNKGRKIFRTATDYYVFDNSTYTDKIFVGLSNQLAINWKISNTFSLQFMGDFGIDLSSRLNQNLHPNLQFSYLGAGIGGKILL